MEPQSLEENRNHLRQLLIEAQDTIMGLIKENEDLKWKSEELSAKLWDLYSTAIPEDAYGGAEEIAEMVAGKSIMYEKDFMKAISELCK